MLLCLAVPDNKLKVDDLYAVLSEPIVDLPSKAAKLLLAALLDSHLSLPDVKLNTVIQHST